MKAKEIAHDLIKEIDRNIIAPPGRMIEPGTGVFPYNSEDYKAGVWKGMQHGFTLLINEMNEKYVKVHSEASKLACFRDAFTKWRSVVGIVRANREQFQKHAFVSEAVFILYLEQLGGMQVVILAYKNNVFGGYEIPTSILERMAEFAQQVQSEAEAKAEKARQAKVDFLSRNNSFWDLVYRLHQHRGFP